MRGGQFSLTRVPLPGEFSDDSEFDCASCVRAVMVKDG